MGENSFPAVQVCLVDNTDRPALSMGKKKSNLFIDLCLFVCLFKGSHDI